MSVYPGTDRRNLAVAEDVAPTEAMSDFACFVAALAHRLMGVDVTVRFLKSLDVVAAYGDRQVCFDVSRLGSGWFEAPLRNQHLELLIREFGHEYEVDRLSSRYTDVLARLGAECTMAAIEDQTLFDLVRHRELRLAPAPDGMVSRTEIVLHLKTPAAQSRLRMALQDGSAPAFALSSELARRFPLRHDMNPRTLEMISGLIAVQASMEGFEPSGTVCSATDPVFRTATVFAPMAKLPFES